MTEITEIIAEHSPYLHSLAKRYPKMVEAAQSALGAKDYMAALHQSLWKILQPNATLCRQDEMMHRLREAKNQAALLIALADLTRLWDTRATTKALSEFADACVQVTLEFLLRQAAAKKQITLTCQEEDSLPENRLNTPFSNQSGVFILGLGKLGAFDLNYSSDIDLIVFYEAEKMTYHGRHSLQHFMNRVVQNLLSVLQDRTADGYVFRTDLRLRPDPSSTPLAVRVDAALNYYETVGQSWERAALIKARSIAGDPQTAEHFLQAIQPFLWRKHLDFAVINDILSIKAQMNSKDGALNLETIQLEGHNIKTGYGGIREIEFFAQIYQLIWGGRQTELRLRNTLDILEALKQLEHISVQTQEELQSAYLFLRETEHRLQMIADQQTHTLPTTEKDMENLAAFMQMDVETLRVTLQIHLARVHRHYNEEFNATEQLDHKGGSVSLLFSGVDIDPMTQRHLESMGFTQTEIIIQSVREWQTGNRRATKTSRSRQILSNTLMPILHALGQTVAPDDAFKRFDAFLSKLSVGVQIFSLFQSNPQLITLIARIMGNAPALGESLNQTPSLLDSVLSGGFYGQLPNQKMLKEELDSLLKYARSHEHSLNIIHQFKQEKSFQLGILLLDQHVDWQEAGEFLTQVAEVTLSEVIHRTQAEFEEKYGQIESGGLAVIALGRMGIAEISFGSDLDLIFVYDAPEGSSSSGTSRSLMASAYYNRLAARIVGAITAKSKYGSLYEIDARLRPFGKDNALAASIQAFNHYHANEAWAFERMALTKARVIHASPSLHQNLTRSIQKHLAQPLPAQDVIDSTQEMRHKIREHFTAQNPSIWNIKYAAGGLMDCDFLAQYYLLCHAPTACPDVFAKTHMDDRLAYLAQHLPDHATTIQTLRNARALLMNVLFYLRLCTGSESQKHQGKHMPEGLKNILLKLTNQPDFATLSTLLADTENDINRLCDSIEP